MDLTEGMQKYFEEFDTMPTFRVSSDVGCDSMVIIPAVDDIVGEVSMKGLMDYIENTFDVHSAEDFLEMLEAGEPFRIEFGPRMTKEEWLDLSESEGC
jgi:hypothetical protein